MKREKRGKNFRRKQRGAVTFTELLAISAMVGIGALAGGKLLGDFNAELSDLGAAVRRGQVSCSGPAGSASSECGGLSVAGTPGFASGTLDDPQGSNNQPEVVRFTEPHPKVP